MANLFQRGPLTAGALLNSYQARLANRGLPGGPLSPPKVPSQRPGFWTDGPNGAGGAGSGGSGGSGFGFAGGGARGGIAPSYRDPAGFFPDRSGARASRLAKTLQDADAGYRGVHAYGDPRTLAQAPGGLLEMLSTTLRRAGTRAGGAAEGQLSAQLAAQAGASAGAIRRGDFVQGLEQRRDRSELIDQLRAMLEGSKMGAMSNFNQYGLAANMLPYQQAQLLASIFNDVSFDDTRSEEVLNNFWGK